MSFKTILPLAIPLLFTPAFAQVNSFMVGFASYGGPAGFSQWDFVTPVGASEVDCDNFYPAGPGNLTRWCPDEKAQYFNAPCSNGVLSDFGGVGGGIWDVYDGVEAVGYCRDAGVSESSACGEASGAAIVTTIMNCLFNETTIVC